MTGHSTKVVVFTFLVTVVACAPLSTVDVTLLRSEHNELEVRVEWGDEGMRMQIEAKPNTLLIRSSANGGETLFYGEKQESLGTFYSALGRSFFTMETTQSDGTRQTTDYSIPSAVNDQAKWAFEQKKIDRMVSLFGREDVQSSTENVIRELTHRPEVRVLEETAHTLGERGVTGRNNRGALLFYTMVLQLVRGRDSESTSHDGSDERNAGRQMEKRQLPPPPPRISRPPIPVTLPPLPIPCYTPPPFALPSYTLPPPALPRVTLPPLTPPRITLPPLPPPTPPRVSRPPPTLPRYTPQPLPLPPLFPPTPPRVTRPPLPLPHYTPPPLPSPPLTPLPPLPLCPLLPPSSMSPVLPTSIPPLLPLSTPLSTPPSTSPSTPPSTPPSTSPSTPPSTPPSTSPTTPPSTPTPSECESHTCTNPRGRLCENCHHGRECPCGLCPLVSECLGMCGPGCSCWSFACGDCCFWDGCYQHDLKCHDSFFSFACLLPFNFACNGY